MLDNYPKISGKVRDIYDIGNDKLVMVTTDRLSAFDCILPSIIPHRARILTELTLFWAKKLSAFNSILSDNLLDMPSEFQKPEFEHRTLLVNKCRMVPYECVVRGFLAGSSWQEYKEKGTVAEVKMPYGLQQNCPLYPAQFTPARKAVFGHDENISFDTMTKEHREAGFLRKTSIEIFNEAQSICFSKGLYVADTKFEFGKDNTGCIVLCDEILTPDNSRFFPVETYKAYANVPSVDKQLVRNYLINHNWNKKDPAPVLPDYMIDEVSKAYQHVLYLLTGKVL